MAETMTIEEYVSQTANPLDQMEAIAHSNEWGFDRRSSEELSIEIPGRWCDFSLYFAWSDDISALHFSCAFDMRVPDNRRNDILHLLALINEKMWLGYFGLWEEEGLPLFRHTTLLRGTECASLAQLEDLVEIATAECDRFYPAFQFVIWGGKTAKEAVEAAMIDTIGEA